MKVLEFEAKALLRGQGFTVPRGEVVNSAVAAAAATEAIGPPVVVKVQTRVGGRMKAGGVRFANTPEEAAQVAGDLLGSQIRDFPVDWVLVEEKLNSVAEIFVGATYDPIARTGVLLASTTGGIDVEVSTQVVRRPFSLLLPVSDYLGREVAAELGFGGSQLLNLATLITKVARCFVQWDAHLLELNPVILDTAGCWWVADVHLELDGETNYRQKSLLAQLPFSHQLTDRRSDFERRAADIDNVDHRGVAGRLIPLDGDLGLLIGGGGASLTILDAMLDAGMKPANYCEIGGNPSVWKIKELTKLILSQPQVDRIAVIMNVVSNTRVDLVARGVIKGVLELGLDPRRVILAFRIPGSWELEGQAILRHYQVRFFGRETSIDQVIEAIK